MLGVVLAGGRSSRFGADKATHVVGGRPMARRVADALLAGGAGSVVAVGGDAGALGAFGLTVHADGHPGQGPLGGLLTALALAGDLGATVVAVVACDLADLDGASVRAVVARVRDDADVAVAVAVDQGGRRQPLLGAWRVHAVGDPVAAAFAAGARSMHAALDAVASAGGAVAEVGVAPGALRNVNHPDDLAR